MMMTRRRCAAVASWDALPAEAIDLVLSHLAGDVRTLCAVACVARAWRDAATQPQLWVSLARLNVARLTDARLIALVARAGGGLQVLDLRGATQVTDAGLAAALQQPHALAEFSADDGCARLSASGVAAALQSRAGCLRELSLRGVLCMPEAIPAEDFVEDYVHVIDTLEALMAPGSGMHDYLICEQGCLSLCRRYGDRCEGCESTVCCQCQVPPWNACAECGEVFCPDCTEEHDCAQPLPANV